MKRINRNHVLLFFTDAESYMIKPAELLTNLFSKMIYITCAGHIRSIIEKIRDQFKSDKKFIFSIKNSFRKVSSWNQLLKSESLKIILLSKPIVVDSLDELSLRYIKHNMFYFCITRM
jgi:hypothetical protein